MLHFPQTWSQPPTPYLNWTPRHLLSIPALRLVLSLKFSNSRSVQKAHFMKTRRNPHEVSWKCTPSNALCIYIYIYVYAYKKTTAHPKNIYVCSHEQHGISQEIKGSDGRQIEVGSSLQEAPKTPAITRRLLHLSEGKTLSALHQLTQCLHHRGFCFFILFSVLLFLPLFFFGGFFLFVSHAALSLWFRCKRLLLFLVKWEKHAHQEQISGFCYAHASWGCKPT